METLDDALDKRTIRHREPGIKALAGSRDRLAQRVRRPRAGAEPMDAALWIPAVWTQFRAGNLTPLFRDVLLRLQKFDRGQGLWPSHGTLADRAGCSVRTAQEALRQGRALGLVAWVSGAGRRTSNRYSLTLPTVAAEAGARLGRAATRAVAKVTALGRALVGKMRGETKQAGSKRPTGHGNKWTAWPAPQAPLRTVAEQLAILAEFRKEESLQERKEAFLSSMV